MPLTSTYYTTLIDPTTVIYFNCGKNGHFTSFYLELKDINNIKKIEEEEKKTSNKSEKKNPKKKLPPRVSY